MERWAAGHGDTAGPVRRGASFVIELLDGAVWVVPVPSGPANWAYRMTVTSNERLALPDREQVDHLGRGRTDGTRRAGLLSAVLDGIEEVDLFFEAVIARYDPDVAPPGANSVTVGANAPHRWLIDHNLRMSVLVDLKLLHTSFVDGLMTERVAAVGRTVMATSDREVDIDATGLGLPFSQALAAQFPDIVQHKISISGHPGRTRAGAVERPDPTRRVIENENPEAP